MSKYLKLLQPAILDNLTRMRGGCEKDFKFYGGVYSVALVKYPLAIRQSG